MARIFLSYRREDAAGHSGRLYDDLEEVFGDDVFRDIDTLEAGSGTPSGSTTPWRTATRSSPSSATTG